MNQRMIKFLAWDIDVKRMSTIVHLGDGIVCFPNDTLPIAFCATRTERFVFRQYTGLNDKDGQEIYEGDVVENHHPEMTSGIYIVRFSLSDFGTRFEIVNHTTGVNRWWKEATCRVIGNIYQNPELLQQ